MFKKSLTAMTVILGLAGTAYASTQLPVEAVDVDETLQTAPWEDSDAAALHPLLPAELSAAIKAELDNRVPENGYSIDVDIWEISMNDDQDLPGDGRFDRLGGFVYIDKSKGTEPDYTFPILMHAVSAENVPTEALEQAMIAAFADETVDRLEGLKLPMNHAGAAD